MWKKIFSSFVLFVCFVVHRPGKLAIEFSNLFDDVSLLILGQFRIDRQRQRIAGGSLGIGEISASVTKITKAILEVERNRIIDFGFYTFFTQESLESISVRKSCDKLIVNMSRRIFW